MAYFYIVTTQVLRTRSFGTIKVQKWMKWNSRLTLPRFTSRGCWQKSYQLSRGRSYVSQSSQRRSRWQGTIARQEDLSSCKMQVALSSELRNGDTRKFGQNENFEKREKVLRVKTTISHYQPWWVSFRVAFNSRGDYLIVQRKRQKKFSVLSLKPLADQMLLLERSTRFGQPYDFRELFSWIK